jgi:hypothetical protein
MIGKHLEATSEPDRGKDESESVGRESGKINIETLLVEAAKAVVAQGIPLEEFVEAAHAIYFRADPERAAQLWNLALLVQFEELRRTGRLPVV